DLPVDKVCARVERLGRHGSPFAGNTTEISSGPAGDPGKRGVRTARIRGPGAGSADLAGTGGRGVRTARIRGPGAGAAALAWGGDAGGSEAHVAVVQGWLC